MKSTPIERALEAVHAVALAYKQSPEFMKIPRIDFIRKACIDCGNDIPKGFSQSKRKRCDACREIHQKQYRRDYKHNHPIITRKKWEKIQRELSENG